MKYEGIVSAYYPSRKFGFILLDDGTSRFFHLSNFHGTPTLGERVEFELGDPVKLGRDRQAVNITPTSTITPDNDALDLLAGTAPDAAPANNDLLASSTEAPTTTDVRR